MDEAHAGVVVETELLVNTFRCLWVRLAQLQWKAGVARRTIAAIEGEIASRQEEEVDLVFFRLDIFACGIDILYE